MSEPPAAGIPLREGLARVAVPLATYAAVAAFAAHEVDRAGAAETAYLGGVAAAALAAVGALAPPPALELGLGGTLAVTLLWTLPDGPSRGAALLLLLAAAFAIASARRLAEVLPELPLATALPMALGVQIFLRGDRLLAPRLDPETLGIFLGWPLLAGVSLAILARKGRGDLALLAGGTVVLLAPGWSPGGVLALVALAAGDLLVQEKRMAVRGLALLALLAPMAWEPRAGLLGAAAALAWAWPRALLLPALLLAGLARFLPPAPRVTGFGGFGGFGIVTLPLLVPAVVLSLGRRSWARPAAALLLTIAARAVPGAAALAPPLALAALATRREGAGATAQRVWTGALVFGAALLAAYPWLRPAPLADLVAFLGPVRAVAAGGVIALLGWTALELAASRGLYGWKLPSPAAIAGAALFLFLLLRLPPPSVRLLRPEQAIRVDAESPVWETTLPGTAFSSLAVESVLTNSANLAEGTPVASVELYDPATRMRIAVLLRAGRETGEWAARRPDVAAMAAHR
ncbi:MAG TPA: hypothetical protein VMM92_08700, partial [Thermoanaerobaculia bacterium]|nr:hypothetical protein [Thermoanaerobaculia bacterium]